MVRIIVMVLLFGVAVAVSIALITKDHAQDGSAAMLKRAWVHYCQAKISKDGTPWSDDDDSKQTVFSESVAYALLLAVAFDDAVTFSRVWQWAQCNLRRDRLQRGDPFSLDFSRRPLDAGLTAKADASGNALTAATQDASTARLRWSGANRLVKDGYRWAACWRSIAYTRNADAAVSFRVCSAPGRQNTTFRFVLVDGDGEDWELMGPGGNGLIQAGASETQVQTPVNETTFRLSSPQTSNPYGNHVLDRRLLQLKVQGEGDAGDLLLSNVVFAGVSDDRADCLLAWKMHRGSTRCPNPSEGDWEEGASDADLDTCMALLLAGRRASQVDARSARKWRTQGIDYEGEAQALADAIWARYVRYLPAHSRWYLAAGDSYQHMTGPEMDALGLNPSYFSPATYRLLQAADEHASLRDWAATDRGLAASSYRLLGQLACVDFGPNYDDKRLRAGNPGHRLPPNWAELLPSGAIVQNAWRPEPHFCLDPVTSGDQAAKPVWRPDAIRVLWRVALDALMFHSPDAVAFIRSDDSPLTLLREAVCEDKLGAGYYHNGELALPAQPGTALAYCTQAIVLAFLIAARDEAGVDCGAEVSLLQARLREEWQYEGHWGDPQSANEYYGQAWAMLGLALATRQFPFLGAQTAAPARVTTTGEPQQAFRATRDGLLLTALPVGDSDIVTRVSPQQLLHDTGERISQMARVRTNAGRLGWAHLDDLRHTTPVEIRQALENYGPGIGKLSERWHVVANPGASVKQATVQGPDETRAMRLITIAGPACPRYAYVCQRFVPPADWSEAVRLEFSVAASANAPVSGAGFSVTVLDGEEQAWTNTRWLEADTHGWVDIAINITGPPAADPVRCDPWRVLRGLRPDGVPGWVAYPYFVIPDWRPQVLHDQAAYVEHQRSGRLGRECVKELRIQCMTTDDAVGSPTGNGARSEHHDNDTFTVRVGPIHLVHQVPRSTMQKGK